MALNIPNVGAPGEGFLKGLQTGGDLYSKLMNAKYNNSLHPSGDVANSLYVQELRQKYGESDPRYIEAKKAHDLVLSGREALINYRDVLNQTAGIRATSPLGKLINEGKGKGAIDILNRRNDRINQGGSPSDARYQLGEQFYNDEGEQVSNTDTRTDDERAAYDKAIGKQTTDAAIRNKIPYAENVKITLSNIKPEDLVQYSGPQGSLKLAWDSYQAASGQPSPEFLAYQTALTGSKTLSKQLRQFWGDSIQPAATDKIDQLTNPSHWTKNPQVALQQFNQLKKITDQELETFKTAGSSPVKLDFKDGNFIVDRNNPGQSKAQKLKEVEDGIINDEDDMIIAGYLPQLQQLNASYTPENIKFTAKQLKTSVGDVIDQLIKRGH